MSERADVIAAALRQPTLRRPYVGHELRGAILQLQTPRSGVAWTATVPQLAQAIDTALRKTEEKDTPGGAQPSPGAAFTARAQILAALQAAGHTPDQAAQLLAQADHEPRDPDPNPDHPETLGGGHALIVEHGDFVLKASCQCGKQLGSTISDASPDLFMPGWERHTNTEVT
jgi:hypothetical protein